MNWLVWAGDATDCVPGMMASEINVPPAVVPPPVAVTVRVAVAEIDPDMAAVIVVEPAPTAVASPEEFTVATAGALDAQVTWSVTFEEVDGWLPWPTVPVAVNCTVWPTTRLCVAGDTWMEATCVLVQPVNGRTIEMSPSTLKQLRVDILSLQAFLAGLARPMARRRSVFDPVTRYWSNDRRTQVPAKASLFSQNQVG
jgi:hypothetical protein